MMKLYEGDKVTVADWDEMLGQNEGAYVDNSINCIKFGEVDAYVFLDDMKKFCGGNSSDS